MRLFDIYEHPRHGLAVVKQGFSWSALLLPSVWAATRGLGWACLLLAAATTLSFNLLGIVAQWSDGIGLLPISAFVGMLVLIGAKPAFNGYRWHAEDLLRDGFEKKQSVVAHSRRHAIQAYRSKHFSSPALIAN